MNARAAIAEPWLWLVIGIPIATLFGGYLTLRLAYIPGGDDTAPDDVVRTGQVQDVELAPDREAARRGLFVSVDVDADSGRIIARQSAGELLPALPIELRFVHPIRADRDRIVTLQPASSGWQAPMPRLPDNHWQLQLQDAGGHWRLVGRLSRRTARAILQPALPSRSPQ